jgi:hypothetical protein
MRSKTLTHVFDIDSRNRVRKGELSLCCKTVIISNLIGRPSVNSGGFLMQIGSRYAYLDSPGRGDTDDW